MGWLATGVCTLFAGYVAHRIVAQRKAVKILEAPKISETDIVPEAGGTPDQDSLGAPEMIHENLHDGNPTSSTTPTFVASSAKGKDGDRPGLTVDNHYSTVPSISRPPPPPPPTLTRPSSPPRLKPPSFGSMLAPPRPGGSLRPPPSSAASLRVPPTKVLQNASMAPTSSIMPPGKQVSRKVVLEPGHSPLDWAALTSKPDSKLRGINVPDNLVRVTPAQLREQNGRRGRDAWTVYQGKVYNITPYVPFHPGGKGEILRGAGKDSVQLFMEVHPWVNWDGMLSECLVGILVGEDEADKSGSLDDMD